MFKRIFLPVSTWAIVLNLLVFLFSVFLITLHRTHLPPAVPLWFSKSWGPERLADPNLLWLFPAIIFSFLTLNNVVAKILFSNHKVLALILVWGALIISLILLFPLYRILLAVI